MRILVLIFLLSSCSANWHLNKAIKKGAKLKEIEVIKYDTTYYSDHYYQVDTVFNNEIIVDYIPQTRWQTRIEYKYDYKRFKDSLKHYQRIYSDSLKNALRTIRIENKTQRKKDNRFNRLVLYFVYLVVISIIGYFILRKVYNFYK